MNDGNLPFTRTDAHSTTLYICPIYSIVTWLFCRRKQDFGVLLMKLGEVSYRNLFSSLIF